MFSCSGLYQNELKIAHETVSGIELEFFSSLESGFPRGSSSPIYSGTGFATPVTAQ